MTRITAIFLAFLFALLASGAPAYLHARDHDSHANCDPSSRVCAANLLTHAPSDPSHQPKHSHTPSPDSCPICFQFHAPLVSITIPAIILDRGPLVEILPDLVLPTPTQIGPSILSCRGPPAV